MLPPIRKSRVRIRSGISHQKTGTLLVLSLGLANCAPQPVQRVVVAAPMMTATATATTVPTRVPNTVIPSLPPATHTVTPSSTPTAVPPTVTETPTSTPTAAAVQATHTETASPVPTNDPPTPVPTPWPTPDSHAAERVAHVPILMYHYVEPLPEDADELRVGLTVQPGIFRQQLAYLHARGYR